MWYEQKAIHIRIKNIWKIWQHLNQRGSKKSNSLTDLLEFPGLIGLDSTRSVYLLKFTEIVTSNDVRFTCPLLTHFKARLIIFHHELMTIIMVQVFLCCNVPWLANDDDHIHPHQNLHYGHPPMMTIIIVMIFQVYLCCNVPRLVLNLAEVIAEVIIR